MLAHLTRRTHRRIAAVTAAVLTAGLLTAAGPAASASASSYPNKSNTGVPSSISSLKKHKGDIVVTKPGTVINKMDIHGFVLVKAKDVTIKNSIIRGGPTTYDRGIVTVASPSASVKILNSEIVSRINSPKIDGVRGMNITAKRVNIHGVIDQFHIYGDNVHIEDSYLHSNRHFKTDSNWNGGPSHDDNIQIQKGKNITIKNNRLEGSYSAGIMITQGQGAVENLTISGNRLGGGGCSVNIAKTKKAPKNVKITNNKFGYDQRFRGCAIKVDPKFPLTLKSNTFTDGKTAKPNA